MHTDHPHPPAMRTLRCDPDQFDAVLRRGTSVAVLQGRRAVARELGRNFVLHLEKHAVI